MMKSNLFLVAARGDKVHPNNKGDQFIAKQLGPVLIKVIQAKLGASA